MYTAKIQWFNHPGSPLWWVSDLPGCIGRTPDPRNPRADWGYTDHPDHLIRLTADEVERLRQDREAVGGLPPIVFEA